MTILIVNSATWGDEHAGIEYPKDVGQWFVEGIDARDRDFVTWEVQKQEAPPEIVPAAVYLSGSSASVYDDLPWISRLSDEVKRWRDAEVPVLGVCFGHQIIAHALGGAVEKNPRGWEVGVHEVELTPEGEADPLFEGLPSRFPVMQSHQDAVVALPKGAIRLAGNELASCQAFSLGDRIRTVQFHPEYTPGHIRFLLTPRRDRLAAAGVDVDAMFEGIRDTVHSRSLLRRFLDRFVDPSSVSG